MAPRRSSTLKLRNGETNESMMMFEVVAPAGSVTPIHLHHEGDEAACLGRRDHLQNRRRQSRHARAGQRLSPSAPDSVIALTGFRTSVRFLRFPDRLCKKRIARVFAAKLVSSRGDQA